MRMLVSFLDIVLNERKSANETPAPHGTFHVYSSARRKRRASFSRFVDTESSCDRRLQSSVARRNLDKLIVSNDEDSVALRALNGVHPGEAAERGQDRAAWSEAETRGAEAGTEFFAQRNGGMDVGPCSEFDQDH